MKVVFDSNIYVSALSMPGGVADRAIRAATQAAVELFISRPILEEVLGVMSRKFARAPEELSRTAIYLASLAEIVAAGRRIDVLTDAPDNRVLECACAANADVIVTGDREMLSLGTWEGIEILSLRQFVDRLGHGRQVNQSRAAYRVPHRQARRKRARATLAAPQSTATKAQEPRSHYGIRPFPKRGKAVVTNELVNKLREGDAY